MPAYMSSPNMDCGAPVVPDVLPALCANKKAQMRVPWHTQVARHTPQSAVQRYLDATDVGCISQHPVQQTLTGLLVRHTFSTLPLMQPEKVLPAPSLQQCSSSVFCWHTHVGQML